ncbi:unnamed protein product [Caenorhabditis angaria]|uniref:Hexosyltransferase n=1 Tax=Caenorhabditis angaria TaxID=860376 RepID=A0A9P1NAN3_9PELO|nr:unnamed protein product [Caenorhabditis angaria]
MKTVYRIFLVVVIVVFCLVFTISTLPEFSIKFGATGAFEAAACLNLPPNQHVHPVFLAQGPKLEKYPQPIYLPNKTNQSISINCKYLRQKTVIVIHSDINDTNWRDYQRSLVSKDWLNYNNAILYFVVGSRTNITISSENQKYGDILQSDIDETYHNISYKAIFWIKEFSKCEETPNLIIKLDDDVHVDLIGLTFLIQRYSKQDDFIACRVFPHGTVVRNPLSKWYLSKKEYKYNDLGTYCQGMAYLFSGNLLKTFSSNIAKRQILWMDDWYVTRSLVGDQKISYYSLDQHMLSTNSENELKQRLLNLKHKKFRTIFAHFRPSQSYPMDKRKQIWSEIISNNNQCR